MGNAHEVCALSKMRCVDDIWSWTHDAHLINPEIWKGENDASISIVYVFCSRRSGNGSWLLDITGIAWPLAVIPGVSAIYPSDSLLFGAPSSL